MFFSLILVSFYIFLDYIYNGNKAQSIALQNASKKIKERELVFKDFVRSSEDVLLALRNDKSFKSYLKNQKNIKEIQEVFLTLSKSQSNFMQLRYLDKNGNEKIRIDRATEASKPYIVAQDKLQNKANRYYFSDSKTKPLGRIWFSSLDLNIEHGKVQKPYNATIRAILPIRNNDKFDGIIIVNYFMNSFLDSFLSMSLYNSVLFDKESNILKHYDKSYDWSYYSESKIKIDKLYPEHHKKMILEQVVKEDEFVSKKLNLSIGNELFLLLQIKKSYIEQEHLKQIKHYIIVGSITFIVSLIIATLIVRKFNTLMAALEKKTQELEATNSNLEKFIDTQDNIVILTDGKIATFANKKFFDFLGFKNLEEFTSQHECICEFFVENDKFFHLGKIREDENWLDVIQTLPHTQRVVSMMGTNFKIHAFSVSINKFNESLLIVSFSDISQTIIEHIRLKEKSVRDKLTDAFNREYFEQNYRNLINEYHNENSKFALALLDIDHFKSVNDTHGHDVGDAVLIQFVQTVQRFSRKDDIFIRWGGEEFVMILKVESEDGLSKALEHLREVISVQDFPIVGRKTCSIGATVYESNEDIYTTLKRADEAVYEAKETGRNKVIIK